MKELTNKHQKIIRPLIFLALTAILCSIAILTKPASFPFVFAACLAGSLIEFILFLKYRRYFLALVFSIATVLCAVFPHVSYISKEKSAYEFADSISRVKDTVFEAKVTDSRSYSSYTVTDAVITRVDNTPVPSNFPCRVECYSGDELKHGDTITFTSTITKTKDIENDSSFDLKSYLRSKEIFLYFPSATLTESRAAEKHDFFDSLRNYIRKTIFNSLEKGFDYTAASVAYAMLMGDKDYLSENTRQSFEASGLSHILCVSGMHVSIIMGALFFILGIFTVHKRLRCILMIAFCLFYIALTGFSPSCIRAGIMCIITYIGILYGKKSDGLLSLFLTALVICFASPYSVLDISAQLSFCSSFAIIALFTILPQVSQSSSALKRKAVNILYTFLSGVAAVIFTLPVCAIHFDKISIMSVFSTLAVSIACNILLVSLLLLLIFSSFSGIFPFPAQVLGDFSRIICEYILWIAEKFSHFRHSLVTVKIPYLYLILLIVILFSLTLFCIFDLKRMIFLALSCSLAVSVIFIGYYLYCDIQNDYRSYSISYFRQNKNDRQLSIKLPGVSYLIINADNKLCFDEDKVYFDKLNGNNYVLLIPDNEINVKLLSENIKHFGTRYGIKKVLVPDNEEGRALSYNLSLHGIECYTMPHVFTSGDTKIIFTVYDNAYAVTADDGKTKTHAVYAKEYSDSYFPEKYGITAFFTRETDNQFDFQKHQKPDSKIFITRLKKDEAYEGITNTFGQSEFYIKE